MTVWQTVNRPDEPLVEEHLVAMLLALGETPPKRITGRRDHRIVRGCLR